MSLRDGRSASSGRSRPGPASSRPAAPPTMSGASTGRAQRSGGRRARAAAPATSATPLVIAVLPRTPTPNAPHAIAVQASAHAASAPLATRSAAGRSRASALPTTHIQAARAASATTPARLKSAGPARHDVGLGRHDADPTVPGPPGCRRVLTPARRAGARPGRRRRRAGRRASRCRAGSCVACRRSTRRPWARPCPSRTCR